MNHTNYDNREIARKLYALRVKERKLKGLDSIPFDQLDLSAVAFWMAAVDTVVAALPEPVYKPEDVGL